MRTQTAIESDRFAQELFTPLPSRYDRLAELLSMGQNGRWRREMVGHVAQAEPQRVLDVACGTAGVTLEIAERTTARIVGVDLTEGMLREERDGWRSRAARNGCTWSSDAVSSCPSPTPRSTR